MSDGLPTYPFEQGKRIGRVTRASLSEVTFSTGSDRNGAPLAAHGYRVYPGTVGDFVFLDCGDEALLARVIRASVEESSAKTPGDPLPKVISVVVTLLTSVRLEDGAILRGVSCEPRIGTDVYAVAPKTVSWFASAMQNGDDGSKKLSIAHIPAAGSIEFGVPASSLLGRHCAVLGATGGGKSWTLARIVEECRREKVKTILIDASGEFWSQEERAKSVYFGSAIGKDRAGNSEPVYFPHEFLTENDLFAIFRPSAQTQAPKLRAAIRSLKLAQLEPTLARDGLIIKSGSKKSVFDEAYSRNYSTIERGTQWFNPELLSKQIEQECVWPNANYGKDVSRWGDPNERDIGYCVTLMQRVEDAIASAPLADVFSDRGCKPLLDVIEEFLAGDDCVLRISLQHLPFELDARPIIANALGRLLLGMARGGRFLAARPCVVAIDEAHNFLGQELVDDVIKYPLDAFAHIAKEGRKYWLTACIATQRPRDVPEDVLSQMGSLIVHRLMNPRDRELVEKASGDIDRAAAEQLPTLAQGEAVLIGVDMAFPLTVQIRPPLREPESRGPRY